MREEYALFAAQPGFARLRRECPLVLATWDDHDYGRNDAGNDHLDKATAQRLFLEFWNEPEGSPRWNRPGVYTSYVFGPPGKRVQVILLDTRTFRSPLRRKPTTQPDIGPYLPATQPDAALLGEPQWAWLADQLKVPAEVRLIGSSIQFIADDQEYEKWGNFPSDRRRFLDLVRSSRASGVIVLSGDRHFCELSRMGPEETGLDYPLYDLTSSSLNSKSRRPKGDVNSRRVGEASGAENFGMVRIDWTGRKRGTRGADPVVTLEVRHFEGEPLIQHRVRLSEFKAR
jgi:alkaline phosphatase D